MAKLIKVWDGSAWQTVGTASTVGVQGTTGTQGTTGAQGITGAQGTTGTATSSSITTWVKTASGGETSLTGSSDSSTTLSYTAGQEQLFINGVLQVRGSDYTATNGTSITGLTALVAGDIATVTSVNAFSVTGAVPLSTVTANGDLIVGTSSGAVGRLGIGSTDQVLKVSGGVPVWATPASGSTFVGCRAYFTATQTIATATSTAVAWTVEDFDTDGFHSTVTNNTRFTIPSGKDGKYSITYHVLLDPGSGNQFDNMIKKNGSNAESYYWTCSGAFSTSVTRVFSAVAGDYFELFVGQNSGSNKLLEGGALYNSFTLTYLGA